MRDSVRVERRVYVKCKLRKYWIPPDKQGKAAQPLLEQAKVPSAEWAAA